MAKKTTVLTTLAYFDGMSSDEILARYNHNCDAVTAIHSENSTLKRMYSEAKRAEKIATAQAKLNIQLARLEALRNPTITESQVSDAPVEIADSIAQ